MAEIAPDVFRVSAYVAEFNLQFNSFLVRDEQPLLYHAGMRSMFPALREAVARLVDPASLGWIGFSHFEVDECGALNEWLALAPAARPLCSAVGALVNMGDFTERPAKTLAAGEVLETGRHRFRTIATPHLPHGWDASMLFEETGRTLFCSDLFHHNGDVEPLTGGDIVGRTREALIAYQATPLMDYLPYGSRTPQQLEQLAALEPRTLAVMHGSSFAGDGARALLDLDGVLRDVLG
ncbi:MAG: MBL fold metallo-hydrolase [Acidobacteria bacterium]|nr:MBL fold metallo-hydrolase [Acidobacteriota bacterium]